MAETDPFGERLRELRQDRGYPTPSSLAAALASHTGAPVTAEAVRQWEKGSYRPRDESLDALEALLDAGGELRLLLGRAPQGGENLKEQLDDLRLRVEALEAAVLRPNGGGLRRGRPRG